MESGRSLFKIINGLRYFGVGTRVKRNIYKFPETYWVITRVKLSQQDQNHGKVYGKLVWRGRARPEEEVITSALKKQWQLVSIPDYKSFNGTADDVNSLIPTNLERTV